MGYLLVGCRLIVGLVFMAAVIGKITGRVEFAAAVGRLAPRLPARPAAFGVVAGEAATVVLLAVPATVAVGLAVAGLLLLAFTVAIGGAVRRGETTACRCFTRSITPIGRMHLVRNGLLLVVTGAGLVTSLLIGTPNLQPAGALLVGVPALVLAAGFVVFDDLVLLFTPLQARQ